jgi:hypothetical protein
MAKMIASKSHRSEKVMALKFRVVKEMEITRGGGKGQNIQKLMIPTPEFFHSDSSSS